MDIPTNIEKAYVYVGLLLIGYVLSSIVKYVKDTRQHVTDVQLNRSIDDKSKKLSLFYWPVYFRLLKSCAAWNQLKRFKLFWDTEDTFAYERRVILGIHIEIRDIINNNMCIIEPDDEMLEQIMLYYNHVRLYETLRETNGGNRSFYPSDFDMAFPVKFAELIKNNTINIQNQYNELVGAVNKPKRCIWGQLFRCCCCRKVGRDIHAHTRNIKSMKSSRYMFSKDNSGMHIPSSYANHMRHIETVVNNSKLRPKLINVINSQCPVENATTTRDVVIDVE